jgi:hypothetical protein
MAQARAFRQIGSNTKQGRRNVAKSLANFNVTCAGFVDGSSSMEKSVHRESFLRTPRYRAIEREFGEARRDHFKHWLHEARHRVAVALRG